VCVWCRCLDEEWCVKCSEERKADEGPRADEPEAAIKEMMALLRRNKTFVDPDGDHHHSHNKQHQQLKALDARADEHRFFVDQVQEADDPCLFSLSLPLFASLLPLSTLYLD
jgi:hypothetical protein